MLCSCGKSFVEAAEMENHLVLKHRQEKESCITVPPKIRGQNCRKSQAPKNSDPLLLSRILQELISNLPEEEEGFVTIEAPPETYLASVGEGELLAPGEKGARYAFNTILISHNGEKIDNFSYQGIAVLRVRRLDVFLPGP